MEYFTMDKGTLETQKSGKMIIKKCHVCGEIHESFQEVQKCSKCKKSFMPANYFTKVHAKNTKEFQNLFCDAEELFDEDLILGLNVLW